MEKIYMLSVVIEAFKQSLMFLCKPSQIVVWYTAPGLYITLHTELTSQTRRDSPCADSPRAKIQCRLSVLERIF